MYKSMCCHSDKYILVNILFIGYSLWHYGNSFNEEEKKKQNYALHKQLLPAGWLAVGPSSSFFHIIVGWGYPIHNTPHQVKFHAKHSSHRQNGGESELKKNIHRPCHK